MKLIKMIGTNKIFHTFFWLALLGLWYFFRYQDYSGKLLAFNITLLKVTDLAFLVYVTNYLLIPQLLYRKKYFAFTACFIALIFSSSWLKMYLEGQLMNNPALFNLFDRFKSRFYDNVIPHFLLVSTGAGFKILIDHAKAQRKIGEMAKENAEAELNFLKSQINPHFVFNSLNAVYFLIDKQNAEARNALHKFSDMLRYQLYECNGSKTNIEKEIAYLRDYIGLQKLRHENCIIEFNCTAEVKGFMIDPLLLIPFVENAFKHLSNYNNSMEDKINIRVSKESNRMFFNVSNTTEPKQLSEDNKHSGIGLKNVKRRLQLLYPGKHSLFVKQQPESFEVKLELEIS